MHSFIESYYKKGQRFLFDLLTIKLIKLIKYHVLLAQPAKV